MNMNLLLNILAAALMTQPPAVAGMEDWSFELKGGAAPCSAVLVKNPTPPAKAGSPVNPWLLTARHCFDNNKPGTATNGSGQTIQLKCDERRGKATCGAVAFDFEDEDISVIEVRPDMFASGTKLAPATIAEETGQLYVFGWSTGFRRIPLAAAPAGANCEMENAKGFSVRGRAMYVNGRECVNEGDSGGAVATSAGRVVGIVRAKNGAEVDVTLVTGAATDPVPKFLTAMFLHCADSGWTRDGCVRVMASERVKGNSLANEAADFADLLMNDLDSGQSWFQKLRPDEKRDILIRLTGLEEKAVQKVLTRSSKQRPE